jgi:hypothetical protein
MQSLMKHLIAVGALVAALVCTSIADLVVVQEIDQSQTGEQMKMTMSFKGEKVRVDVGDQASIIMDGKDSSMTNLIHAHKMYIVMSGEQVKAMVSQATAMMKAQQGEQTYEAKLEKTGQTAEINGYKTEAYTQKVPGGTCTYWIAKDYKGYESILKQLHAMQDSALGKMVDSTSGMPKMKAEDFPGMPIRTEVDTPQSGKVTMTLVSAKEEKLDDSLFKAPEGYSTMNMPDMPVAPVAP